MIEVELPWPPRQSSPNGPQGNYKGKAEAGKRYKNRCLLECIAQKVPKAKGPVEVAILFCPPSAHKYDLDNALAKTKRGLDAVAYHIGVDDAEWNKITLQRGPKVAGGAVYITIKETT